MKAARLVVLGVAVAAGGVAALLAGRSEKPPGAPSPQQAQIETVEVLVAKGDIAMGQTVGAAATCSGRPGRRTPPAAISSRKNQTGLTRSKSLAGAIARAPFVAGEPIREAKLVQAKGSGFMAAILPPGMRAVSTQISPETGAGGFILPNDRVDVILTRRDRAAEKATGSEVQTSETILKNIRVLAIDQNVEEKDGQKRRDRQDRDARAHAAARPRRSRSRRSSAPSRSRCAASPTRIAKDDDDKSRGQAPA